MTRGRWVLPLASIVLVTCGRNESTGPGPSTAPTSSFERDGARPDATHGGSGSPRYEDDPALVIRGPGDSWVACVTWDGEHDAIEVRSLSPDDDERRRIHLSSTRLHRVTAAVDDGVVQLLWSERDAAGWSLRGTRVAPPLANRGFGAVGEITTVFERPGAHLLEPCLASDGHGALLLVALRLTAESSTVVAASRTDRGWSPLTVVSEGRRSAWSPTVCATGARSFAVAWDGAVDGDFDVSLARVTLDDDGAPRVSSVHPIAATRRFEAEPDLAWDGDRLYVAYHVAGEDWGREGSANDVGSALHDWRRIEVVAIEDDRIAPLAHPVDTGLPDALASNSEQPRIAIDGAGNLVVAFRALPLRPDLDDPSDQAFRSGAAAFGIGEGWRASAWYTLWRRFDGERWTREPWYDVALGGSDGRCDAGFALAVLEKGHVAYAVTGDARHANALAPPSWWRPLAEVPTHVSVGALRRGSPAEPIALGPSRPLDAARPSAAPRRARATRTIADGRSVSLALGDLHRHTDLSRCSGNWDGTLLEAFRYAFDVAPLDFLAVTDHFEHMTSHDLWRSQTLVDAYHVPGRMVNLHAYERSDPDDGHRNVVTSAASVATVGHRLAHDSSRDAHVALSSYDFLARLDARDVVTIPHTPAGHGRGSTALFRWDTLDPELDRVVELFQSYRGSSEAPDADRAIGGQPPSQYIVPQLRRGLHFGFVASSDHQTSGGAFAGAWVTSLTRRGVLEALRARRTFAATAPMSVWASWRGADMGALVTDRGPDPRAPFVVEVDAHERRIARIELVVDGELVTVREIGPARATETFLLEPADRSTFAYARIVCADGELGWTSPIRFERED